MWVSIESLSGILIYKRTNVIHKVIRVKIEAIVLPGNKLFSPNQFIFDETL